MVSKEEFNKYLDELMSKDKNNRNLKHLTASKFYSSEGIGRIAFILLFVGLCSFTSRGFFWLGVALTVLSILCFAILVIMVEKANQAEKYYAEYQKKVIDYLLDGYKYTLDKRGSVDKQVFIDSQFLQNKMNGYSGEDKLVINIPSDKGEESSHNLILSEVNSFGEECSFRGVFGYIELPHEFKCTLCINGTYDKELSLMEPVELEDIDFNETFKVLSDNQVEARYILTPNVMDTLLKLNEKTKLLKITLVDNRVYFGFKSMKLFDVSFVKKGEVTSMFSGFYDPMAVCLGFLDEIKKNDKVFKI